MPADVPSDAARIVEATFERSASDVSQCPAADMPEVAIAGRSNVGKSSLLNALCGRRGLARVSRTPGRTQLLNLFTLVIARHGQRHRMRLVDLPGYGYAAAGRAVTDRFGPMIEGYLTQRDSLVGLVLLVDLRRGVTALDRQMMEFLSSRELPTLLVATKADKLGASKRPLAVRDIAASVGVHPGDVVLTSASTGVGIHGRGGLVDDLADLISDEHSPEPAGVQQ